MPGLAAAGKAKVGSGKGKLRVCSGRWGLDHTSSAFSAIILRSGTYDFRYIAPLIGGNGAF